MDLTMYGFDQTKARFESYLSTNFNWSAQYQTASAQAFIKMYAWVMEALAFLTEETVRDLKWGTSYSLQAVLEHTKLVGYPVHRNISSLMVVRFSVDSALAQDVVISQWVRTRFLEKYYSVKEDSVLISGNTYVDVDVIQGHLQSFTFTGTGVKDQFYDITQDDVEDSNVTVTVDGIPWTRIDDFVSSGYLDKHFLVRTIYGGVRIEFGDGIYGMVPPTSSVINVEALVSLGVDGNINTTGLTGDLIDPVLGPGGSPVAFTLTSVSEATGGIASEDVASIKRNVPAYITSGGVYKRKSELITIFRSYAEVAQANVYAEADKDEIDRDMARANIIHVYLVPNTGYSITQSFITTTLNGLIEDEKLLMNTTYDIQEADYIYFRPLIDVYVSKTVSLSTIYSTIEQRLLDFFETFEFGKDFFKHLFHRALTEYLDSTTLLLVRDSNIANIRIVNWIVQEQISFEGFGDEFIEDHGGDPLDEDGDYFSASVGEGTADNCLWIEHTGTGILQKYPITRFKVEVNGTAVVDLTASGTFSTPSCQGTVNFTTGVYGISVASDVTDIALAYTYYDDDVPLSFSEFPRCVEYDISPHLEVI